MVPVLVVVFVRVQIQQAAVVLCCDLLEQVVVRLNNIS